MNPTTPETGIASLIAELGVATSDTGRDDARLGNYRTKTEIVYQELRERLLAGHYPPGTRVVADQVASELQLSRITVREAIVRLTGEGWLESSPHVGAIVPRLKPYEILETAIIRAALEGRAVRFAVDFLSDADLERLATILEETDAAARSDAAEYPQLNAQFHEATYEACPLPNLKEMTRSLAQKSLHWRTVRLLPSYLSTSQLEHHRIYDALKERDGELAEQLVRDHIETAGSILCRFALDNSGTEDPV